MVAHQLLRCPWCGKAELHAIMEWRGYSYLSYEVVVGVECLDCYSEFRFEEDPDAEAAD